MGWASLHLRRSPESRASTLARLVYGGVVLLALATAMLTPGDQSSIGGVRRRSPEIEIPQGQLATDIQLGASLGRFVQAGSVVGIRVPAVDPDAQNFDWTVPAGLILRESAGELIWQVPAKSGLYTVEYNADGVRGRVDVEVFEHFTAYDGDDDGWYVNYFDHVARGLQRDADRFIALNRILHATRTNANALETSEPRRVIEMKQGSCDQLAQSLATLAVAKGYQARILYLRHQDGVNQHTVAEVFYDEKWHLFDPDHGVEYSLPDGSLASFADLLENPGIVDRVPDPWVNESSDIGMRGFYTQPAERKIYVVRGRASNVSSDNEELWEGKWAKKVFAVDPTAFMEDEVILSMNLFEYPGNVEPLDVEVNGNKLRLNPGERKGEYIWRTVPFSSTWLKPEKNEIILKGKTLYSWSLGTVDVLAGSSLATTNQGMTWATGLTGLELGGGIEYLITLDKKTDVPEKNDRPQA